MTTPDESTLLGTLVIVVLRARHLPSSTSSRWAKQSPYATLTLFGASPMLLHSNQLPQASSPEGVLTPERSTSPQGDSLPDADMPNRIRKNSRAKVRKGTQDPPSPPGAGEVALSTRADERGGQHPEWDAELRFPIYSLPPSGQAEEAERRLRVEVWAHVPGLTKKPDELLGEGSVDVEGAVKKGEMNLKIPLSRNGAHRGELALELTFFSLTPPPPVPPKDPTPALASASALSSASSALAAVSRFIGGVHGGGVEKEGSWTASVADVGYATGAAVVGGVLGVAGWGWKRLVAQS